MAEDNKHIILCDCPFCPIELFLKTNEFMKINELYSLTFYVVVEYKKYSRVGEFCIKRIIKPEFVGDSLKDHVYNAFLFYHQNKKIKYKAYKEYRNDMKVYVFKSKNINSDFPLFENEKAYCLSFINNT